MKNEYSIEVCRNLKEKFRNAKLYRPMRIKRYDAGTELVYEVESITEVKIGKVHLVIEQFVGGGFAGQVYRVKVLKIETEDNQIGALKVGGIYAMKILIPPSGFSRLFRNILYWIGFQGAFQLQVNPKAARAGALWQKFIRRGAKIRFGDESAVVDIYATFIDNYLGSCGELSEWVEGRTWRLEVDDRMDILKLWRHGKSVSEYQLGSLEYRTKYMFMNKFVNLLYDMGGYEFARQYEWSTCMSQPNCLKRKSVESNSNSGLVAVDFRAGLALLPFLPMSPGDFRLIFKGAMRGSLVQFDRGNIGKLEEFVKTNKDKFCDLSPMLKELKETEQVYRDSIPDITHNHIRLLYSSKLWSTILDRALVSWKVRKIIDDVNGDKIRSNRCLTILFFLLGLIPFSGSFVRRFWGRTDLRKHYENLFTSWGYFKRAFRARIAEKVIAWYRSGRIDETHAYKVVGSICLFLVNLPFSILPAGLHRFLTDWKYTKERLSFIFVRPVRLYFDQFLREQWLHDMVKEGQKKHILTDEDSEIILSQIKEPFIQKYLKSLAVHVCTLPVTQIVSVLIAIIYILSHPEVPRAQAWGIGIGIIALFQVIPISPGSLVRGFYVLYLVIKERNFKDYNIAVFLSFFKYVGYLAFPIQMTYHYPALARFMAGHWATEAVHIIPVFGERGALLEHWIFCLFYNWPLTIRRRMQKRVEYRKKLTPRFWHIGICTVVVAGIFGITDFVYLKNIGELPNLKQIWWFTLFVPLFSGIVVTLNAGSVTLWKRIIGAAVCGGIAGILYTVLSTILGFDGSITFGIIAANCLWRVFIFTLLSTISAIITELSLPDPDL